MIKQLIAFSFSIICSVSFAVPSDNVEKSIKQLKFYISQYPQHADDVKWVGQFNAFLKAKIIESENANKITMKACLLRPMNFGDCIGSSLGFDSTAVGIKNTLNFTLKNCNKTPHDANCLLYQRMLNQDITQMKYILRV